MSFSFNPADGYRNTTNFPTKPPNEAAFRDAMQRLLDQLRDYMNTSLLIVTDGNLTIANADQRLLLQSFYQAGVTQYAVIDSKNGAGAPMELKLNPSEGPVTIGGAVTLRSGDQRLLCQAVYIPGTGQYGLIKALNGAGGEVDLSLNPGGGTVNINGGKAWHALNAGPFYRGSGSPEGSVSAPVGSIFQRTDGGASTTLYVKQSGTGNTGWARVNTTYP